MANVYVSIGSNINASVNICSCIHQLRVQFSHVTLSTIYQTPAEGFVGNPFLNLVVGFKTELAFWQLHAQLRNLEDQHGRLRDGVKYSARPLDIDILLYDQLNLRPQHNLPHSDIERYAFVLYPLAEIAPFYTLPHLSQSVAELAAKSHLNHYQLKPITLDCRLNCNGLPTKALT